MIVVVIFVGPRPEQPKFEAGQLHQQQQRESEKCVDDGSGTIEVRGEVV